MAGTPWASPANRTMLWTIQLPASMADRQWASPANRTMLWATLLPRQHDRHAVSVTREPHGAPDHPVTWPAPVAADSIA